MTEEQNEQLCDTLDGIREALDTNLNTKNFFGEYMGDVLHDINYNLSRIADVLEEVAKKAK